MRVKAKARGYFGDLVREPGDEFDIGDAKPGKWMVKPDGSEFDFSKEEDEKSAEGKAQKAIKKVGEAADKVAKELK
jgi:hypothetical protein